MNGISNLVKEVEESTWITFALSAVMPGEATAGLRLSPLLQEYKQMAPSPEQTADFTKSQICCHFSLGIPSCHNYEK